MMRRKIKRLMPDRKKIVENGALQIFGRLLHDPNLWHLNCYSVATAFSIGLFSAWIPIPFQMVLAASLAIALQANLAISVALVWVTNPVTMPPLFFFAYKLGTKMMNAPIHPFKFQLSFEWLFKTINTVGLPLLVGGATLGILSAVISNFTIRAIWRYRAVRSWRNRRRRKLAASSS